MKNFASEIEYLSKRDPVLRKWCRVIGGCTFKPDRRRSMFEALVRAVAHQQLHGKAAENILSRFIALIPQKDNRGFPQASAVLKIAPQKLRVVGFSEAKVLSIRDIAQKMSKGDIPTLVQAQKMTDAEIIEALIPVRGVGRWTAEMILIFTLGRLNVLPVDDFGIRDGYKIAFGKKIQPKPKVLAKYGERWAPYRTIASWYLWRVADRYKKIKSSQ